MKLNIEEANALLTIALDPKNDPTEKPQDVAKYIKQEDKKNQIGILTWVTIIIKKDIKAAVSRDILARITRLPPAIFTKLVIVSPAIKTPRTLIRFHIPYVLGSYEKCIFEIMGAAVV